MALRSEQVRVVGPTSVQELLTQKILVLTSKKTRYIFVPKASGTIQLNRTKTIKFLKTFEEV
ncbi:MAG: hypothetical protein DSY42_04895 [Aquifex sp.]|nr:MAG: hypothetical protein DSY42_04895 [Aquifex sp.]